MNRHPLVRGLVVATVIGASVGTASIAAAQVASVGTIPLPSRTYGVRIPSQLPYWINRQDCLKDDFLTFSMTLGGPFNNYNLEVWAGTACLDTATRIGSSATCWKVGAANPQSTPFAIPIRARDIVAHNLPSSLVPANDQGVKPGTIADCTSTSTTPPQEVVLNFMLVTVSSGVAQTGAQAFKMGVDIWGPAPPTGVTAGSGETRLHLGWTRSVSSDVVRYDFYCDPPPGAGLGLLPDSGLKPLGLFPPLPGLETFAADGSVGGSGGLTGAGGAGGFSVDAGTGGTTTTYDGSTPAAPAGPECKSGSGLTPGQPVTSTLDQNLCGSSPGKQASSGIVEGLVNNVEYVVTVVGVDNVNNQGVLSGQACGTPEEITDFFELYRQAGGSGGGGICSITGPVERAPGPGAALGAMAAAWLVRRRGRRR